VIRKHELYWNQIYKRKYFNNHLVIKKEQKITNYTNWNGKQHNTIKCNELLVQQQFTHPRHQQEYTIAKWVTQFKHCPANNKLSGSMCEQERKRNGVRKPQNHSQTVESRLWENDQQVWYYFASHHGEIWELV
jgi:hypothetical protein